MSMEFCLICAEILRITSCIEITAIRKFMRFEKIGFYQNTFFFSTNILHIYKTLRMRKLKFGRENSELS